MANLSNINNKLLVGTNGEVRIGDTATVANVKLRVVQTANQWVQQIVSTGGGYGLSIDTTLSTHAGAGSLQIYTNAGTGFIVQNSGFVGIGTHSPIHPLYVDGDIGQTDGSRIWFRGSSSSSGTGAQSYVFSDGLNLKIKGDDNVQLLGDGGGVIAHFDYTGDVGIGTITPDALLELSKSVANAQGATLRLTNAVGGAGAGVAVEFVGPGTQPIHAKIITEDAGAYDSDLIFQTKVTGTGGALVDRLIIDENGDVGINTTPRTSANKKLLSIDSAWGGQLDIGVNGTSHAQFGTDNYSSGAKCRIQSASSIAFKVNGGTLVETIDAAGSIAIGGFIPSGTPTGDYRSLEIGRQGNTITGSPFKSALYLSTNATITAGSTQFTYRYASVPAIFQGMESNGDLTFSNATSGSAGGNISFTPRMRIFLDGDITMGQFVTTQAPANGILKIRTSGSTANVCYPLLYIGGSTHLATRQYGIGFDPEGYTDRMKMFFGADGMGNGYSYGDFVWNINTTANNDTVTPANEKMRLDKGGDLKLKTGNLVVSDTSKGIVLGGTSTANQIRIYQHGTWAPQIYYQNATDQANATNSTQVGLYTRIGNMCMVQFRLVWNQASGTPAVDNIGIKNLPFGGSTTNTYGQIPCFIKQYTGGPSPRGDLLLTLPTANSTVALFADTNNVGNMGNAIGSGTKEMRFSFTYTTNG